MWCQLQPSSALLKHVRAEVWKGYHFSYHILESSRAPNGVNIYQTADLHWPSFISYSKKIFIQKSEFTAPETSSRNKGLEQTKNIRNKNSSLPAGFHWVISNEEFLCQRKLIYFKKYKIMLIFINNTNKHNDNIQSGENVLIKIVHIFSSYDKK